MDERPLDIQRNVVGIRDTCGRIKATRLCRERRAGYQRDWRIGGYWDGYGAAVDAKAKAAGGIDRRAAARRRGAAGKCRAVAQLGGGQAVTEKRGERFVDAVGPVPEDRIAAANHGLFVAKDLILEWHLPSHGDART